MNNQVLNNQERGIIYSQRTETSTETGGYSDGPLDSHQTTCMRKPTAVKPRSHTVWNSPRRHLLAACFTTSMSCCFGTTVTAFEVWNNPTINVIFLCRYQTHTAWSPLLPPHIPQVRKWCGVTFACCYFVNVICGGFVSVLFCFVFFPFTILVFSIDEVELSETNSQKDIQDLEKRQRKEKSEASAVF